MERWQPIDTAPKDGTAVLVWCGNPHGRHCVAVCVGDTDAAWMDECGTMLLTEETGLPTHWKPLPVPPEDAAVRPDRAGGSGPARCSRAVRPGAATQALPRFGLAQRVAGRYLRGAAVLIAFLALYGLLAALLGDYFDAFHRVASLVMSRVPTV